MMIFFYTDFYALQKLMPFPLGKFGFIKAENFDLLDFSFLFGTFL